MKSKATNADKYYSKEAKRALIGATTSSGQRGGARPGSGRHPKTDKAHWGQITCILRKDTIARLRAGADSKHFGDFLQDHLDRYPLPSRQRYLAMLNQIPVEITIKRRRKLPVLISSGSRQVRTRAIPQPKRKLSAKEFAAAILAADNH